MTRALLPREHSPARDPSFWKADVRFLQGFVPLREYLRRPHQPVCDTDVSVTLEDMRALSAFRVEGFRLTLGLGPAVADNFAATGSAGNKTTIFPHLGVIQLASFLRAFGAVVAVRDALVDAGFSDADKLAISDRARLLRALAGQADAELEGLLDRWLAFLDLRDADALGLSAANEADALSFVLLKRRMHACGLRVPLIVGGYWLYESFRPFGGEIDVLVFDEGEVPLLLACHARRHRKNPRWIPGVAFLREDGGWHLHKATHSMNVRAVPDLTGFPLDRYSWATYAGWEGPTIPYQFSLGCPFDCAYCNAAHKRRFKQRDHRLVLHDLQRLHDQHGVRQFFFLNEAFNSSGKYADALLAGMTAAKRDWRWCDCARPTNVDLDLLQRMRAAGCEWLNWGYDTLSDRMSEFYGRRVKSEPFARVLADSASAGIRNSINVIVGMPHETEADVVAFLDFARRNRHNIHWVFLFTYDFIAHSALGQSPAKYGVQLRADGQGVDEIGGLKWPERRAKAALTLARIEAALGPNS